MQFGFVAIYLSESFIRGFMTAAGLQILISVLKYVFGLTVPSYTGPLAIVYVSGCSGQGPSLHLLPQWPTCRRHRCHPCKGKGGSERREGWWEGEYSCLHRSQPSTPTLLPLYFLFNVT